VRILAWVHLYPPDHCAGAEMMLHEILTDLQARGHETHVVCDASSTDEFDGVPVTARNNLNTHQRDTLVDWADIVVTHLDRTRDAITTVARRRPIVHLVHNDRQLRFHRVRPNDAQLVVANSQWIAKAIRWPGPSIVVRPPVHPDRHHVDRPAAQACTLVNLSQAKGADTFWALAHAMPDQQFLGVVGGYGKQEIPATVPDNVTVIPHGPDMRAVYRQTRILLAPSAYESWGRVGIEAAASGIPTIAHPTPGLLESLRGAGTFVDRDDITGWASEIRTLADPDIYAARSRQALARSVELDPTPDMDRLEAAMASCITKVNA
jgi:glycosyltransferase involved in cell wall biosynthesis